ncbi:MAG: SusC/RagA family TonB-linked outer membrane protein [Candidatus Cryptobacteroides sp.]
MKYFLFKLATPKRWQSCLLALVCAILPCIGQGTLHAQTPASGHIYDEFGNPVPGCLVYVKGSTTNGTQSDNDGFFSMSVPKSSTLVFSMLGMEEVELPAAQGMKVTLASAMNELDDVVVVGYGTQKKASLTGAISSINNDEILTTKSQSLAVSLAGKVPGLRIRETNGMPGAFAANINMRGLGTPMIVIDGVVRQETTEFQKLNPDDIESVTVLKDASAAIYGMNSSNGAILITTKSGKEGPLKVTVSMNVGLATPTDHVQMMNGEQYWITRNEERYYSTGTPYFSTPEDLAKYTSLPDTDWYAETFKKAAVQQTYNLSVEGGNKRVQSYTNVGYTNDNGLLKSGDIGYNKFSLRNGTKFKVTDWLKVDLSLYGYVDERKQPGTWDDAFFYLNKAVHGIIPTEPVYANNNPNYFNRPLPLNDNPVLFSERDYFGYGEWKDKFFQGNMAITIDIPRVSGLFFKAAAFYDMKATNRTRVQKRVYNYTYDAANDTYNPTANYDPSIRDESTVSSRFNSQLSANYKNTFGAGHNVGAVAVFETRHEEYRFIGAKRDYEKDFFTLDEVDRAPTSGQEGYGHTGESAFVSVIGRFNYDFKGRYLVEFSFREDGSYRYHPDIRWGFFPVVSAGWNIAKESWVANKAPFINNLKIRASWGQSGEDAGSAFQYIAGYKGSDGAVLSQGKYTNGYASSGLVNKYLTWVKTEMTNIGFDLGLWDGMLDYSMDFYRRDRKGLLATRGGALPNTFGATLPQENLNSDRTQGVEFYLGHKNTVGDFYYNISGNLNIARSMELYRERTPFRSSMDRWKNGSKNRYQGFGWGYQVLGQFQSEEQIDSWPVMETAGNGMKKTLPGDYIHKDVNGDGVIDGEDVMPIFFTGDPKMTYGLTIALGWKGIDFNMLWAGAALYTAKYSEILGNVLSLMYSNSPAYFMDRWHKADLYDPNSEWVPGKYPAPRRDDGDNGANRLESPINRVNASYFRLKNVELGYTVPAKKLAKAHISGLRIYYNMTNPFIICNKYLKEYDPEISDGNGFQYPIQKSYNFGVNISF